MFIVAEGVVTPTDRDGNPATDERGKTYTQKLRDGEHPKLMASRLTEELRLALRGHAPINGSGGPIVIQTSNEPDISPTPSTARREAAEEEVAKRRATDAQVLEDAERLIAAWNERQAKRMPMLFSLTIGAAITAGYWFLWVSCQRAERSMRLTFAPSTVTPTRP